MCRLFGQISETPSDIRQWMFDAPHPFVGWSGEHSHGCGIGWYDGGSARVVKEPKPAKESSIFAGAVAGAHSQLFIAHLRKATCGEYTTANSQPFQSGNWLFAHNGTVDRQYLLDKLDGTAGVLEGETDSEVYFRWLLQNLNQLGVFGLPAALDAVRERTFTALNFLASDGRSLYAYWEKSLEAKAKPDYYQLYYSEIAEPIRTLIVCSERLDDREWIQLPERSLLVANTALKTQIIPI